MTETTAPANEATACACSRFDALDPEQLTDANLESGDYDVWTTGCTQTTRNTFAPGHDAKLKSFLIKHSVEGHEVRELVGGTAVSRDAVGHANQFGFAHMVDAGIKRWAFRLGEQTAKKAAKAAAKRESAERKLAEKAKVVKPLATVVAEEEAAHKAAEVAKVQEREASASWADQAPIPGGSEPKVPTAEVVKAKVGRWVYEGTIADGEFAYTDKNGKAKSTRKFTEV